MNDDQRLLALGLLESACVETSNASVADRIGYTRAAVSTVRRRVYAGNPDRILERVLDVLGKVPCPYVRYQISREECRAVWSGETPSHDPALLAYRRMCQSCEHKQPAAVRSPQPQESNDE